MKTFKVITTEVITYEVEVEAKDFDDACSNWHSKDGIEYKIINSEWTTEKVKERS